MCFCFNNLFLFSIQNTIMHSISKTHFQKTISVCPSKPGINIFSKKIVILQLAKKRILFQLCMKRNKYGEMENKPPLMGVLLHTLFRKH